MRRHANVRAMGHAAPKPLTFPDAQGAEILEGYNDLSVSWARRGESLPGYWTVLFVRAMVEHPAGYDPLLAHDTEKSLLPSSNSAPWASGKVIGFGAAWPMAHTLACLRFAGPISETVARLATGLGGLTLRRTGFAPAGRHTKFHEGIATSNSL